MGKILIYGMLDGFGGIEKYIMNFFLYGKNTDKKYGCIIIGQKSPFDMILKEKNIDVFYTPSKRKLLKNYAILKKILKENKLKYDSIYINTSGLYYPMVFFLAKKYKYKIFLHSHLAEVNDYRKPLHLLNRHFVNKFILKKFACSQAAAEWMFEKKYLKEVKIIPNAIDLNKFVYNPLARIEIRSQLHIADDTLVIGNVARLSYVKNQKFALDVLKELLYSVKAKLILVGDGEDKDELIQYTEKLGISNNVVFWGYTDEPERIMNSFDCTIMPSVVEGFPISLIENQAAGLECFVSDTITKEVNVSGHVHFLPLNNRGAWVNEILAFKKERYNCRDLLAEKGYNLEDFESKMWKVFND